MRGLRERSIETKKADRKKGMGGGDGLIPSLIVEAIVEGRKMRQGWTSICKSASLQRNQLPEVSIRLSHSQLGQSPLLEERVASEGWKR